MKHYPYKIFTKLEKIIAAGVPSILLIVLNIWFYKYNDKDIFVIKSVFSVMLAIIPAYIILRQVFGLKSPVLTIHERVITIPNGIVFPTKYTNVHFSEIIEVRNWRKERDQGVYIITKNSKFKISYKSVGLANLSEIVREVSKHIAK